MTKTEKRLVYWLKLWLCRLGFVALCGAVACTLRGAWAGAMGVGVGIFPQNLCFWLVASGYGFAGKPGWRREIFRWGRP